MIQRENCGVGIKKQSLTQLLTPYWEYFVLFYEEKKRENSSDIFIKRGKKICQMYLLDEGIKYFRYIYQMREENISDIFIRGGKKIFQIYSLEQKNKQCTKMELEQGTDGCF